MPLSQVLLSGEPRISLNLIATTWAGKHKGENISDTKYKVIANLLFSSKVNMEKISMW